MRFSWQCPRSLLVSEPMTGQTGRARLLDFTGCQGLAPTVLVREFVISADCWRELTLFPASWGRPFIMSSHPAASRHFHDIFLFVTTHHTSPSYFKSELISCDVSTTTELAWSFQSEGVQTSIYRCDCCGDSRRVYLLPTLRYWLKQSVEIGRSLLWEGGVIAIHTVDGNVAKIACHHGSENWV